MCRKGIYKYLSDLVSNFKELVEFSLSSAIVKIAVTNKTLVKTNTSKKKNNNNKSFTTIETQK